MVGSMLVVAAGAGAINHMMPHGLRGTPGGGRQRSVIMVREELQGADGQMSLHCSW